MMTGVRLLSASVGVLLASLAVASAADLPIAERIETTFSTLPAVSAINAKFDIRGGVIGDDAEDSALVATGALSFPVGHRFGLQLDGAGGAYDEDPWGGAAVHLFWRNPAFALLGFYGSFTHFDGPDVDVARVSGEGELYWGRFDLSAIVGFEFSDDFDGIFDIADLSFFPVDDLRLYAGHRFSEPGHRGIFGLEYQLPLQMQTGVALFAEGRVGEDDFAAAWGGVRLYFGPGKSLIRRHREDDPRVRLQEDFYPEEEQNLPPPPPPPPPPPIT